MCVPLNITWSGWHQKLVVHMSTHTTHQPLFTLTQLLVGTGMGLSHTLFEGVKTVMSVLAGSTAQRTRLSSAPASTAVTSVAMKLGALSVTVKQYTEGRLADSRSMFSPRLSPPSRKVCLRAVSFRVTSVLPSSLSKGLHRYTICC